MSSHDRVRLTKRVVDTATASKTDYTIWDADVPGFGLCVRKSGRKVYLLKYRVGSGRAAPIRKPTIGSHGAMTVDQARKIARMWLAEARLGNDPSAARRAEMNAPLMKELFDRFLADHAVVHKKESSAREDRRMIENHLLPTLGSKRVKEVTRADIIELHSGKAETPYLANRLLSLLSKAFNLAELWGLRMDGSNPCRHVKKYPEEKRRRFLSDLEFAELGSALKRAELGELLTARGAKISPYAVAAIRLLMMTGARRGEILGLRWDEIDFKRQRAELADSKTGAKFVYLPNAAVEVLQVLPRLSGNPHVIAGGKPGRPLVNLKEPWDAVRREAGLEDVRLHDLRHSFASMAVANGMSLPVLGALLGHKETSTTARYAHLADDPLRSAAALVGSQIEHALGE